MRLIENCFDLSTKFGSESLIGIERQDPIGVCQVKGSILLGTKAWPILRGTDKRPIRFSNLQGFISALGIYHYNLISQPV